MFKTFAEVILQTTILCIIVGVLGQLFPITIWNMILFTIAIWGLVFLKGKDNIR